MATVQRSFLIHIYEFGKLAVERLGFGPQYSVTVYEEELVTLIMSGARLHVLFAFKQNVDSNWTPPPPVVEVDESLGRFTRLLDTPKTYKGHELKLVRVRDNALGLEFIDPLTILQDELKFTKLKDAPTNYLTHGGKVVSVKADEKGLEFKEYRDRLTKLLDAPSSYTGS